MCTTFFLPQMFLPCKGWLKDQSLRYKVKKIPPLASLLYVKTVMILDELLGTCAPESWSKYFFRGFFLKGKNLFCFIVSFQVASRTIDFHLTRYNNPAMVVWIESASCTMQCIYVLAIGESNPAVGSENRLCQFHTLWL